MTDNRTTTWTAISLRATAIILVTSLVLLPVAWFLIDATPAGMRSPDRLREMLFDSSVQAAFLRTVSVALLACGLASLMAVPAAIAIARGIPGAGALIVLFGILPLAMPPFVTAAIIQQLAKPIAFERFTTLPVFAMLQQPDAQLVITYALHYFPLIVFCLATAVAGFERGAEDTARNLRASTWTTWRQILLPLATPGFILGATIMLLRIIEDVASPLVLGIDNMLAPSFLQGLLERGPGDAQLLTSGLLMLGLSTVLLVLAWSAFQLPSARYAAPFCTHHGNTGRSGFVILTGILAGIATLLLALLPLAGLTYVVYTQEQLTGLDSTSLTTVKRAIHDTMPMLSRTLFSALAAGLILTLIAAGLGTLSNASGKTARLLRSSLTLLIAIPGVLLAASYLQLGQRFAADSALAQTAWLALVCVVVIKLLPLGHYLAVSRLRRIHPALVETAFTLAGQRTLQYGSAMLGALSGMLTAVFMLGMVGTLIEISAALVLFDQTEMPFAMAVFTLAGQAGAWAVPAMLLFIGGASLLAMAAFSRAGRCERTAESAIHPAKSLGEQW